jgi:hypothetical protein
MDMDADRRLGLLFTKLFGTRPSLDEARQTLDGDLETAWRAAKYASSLLNVAGGHLSRVALARIGAAIAREVADKVGGGDPRFASVAVGLVLLSERTASDEDDASTRAMLRELERSHHEGSLIHACLALSWARSAIAADRGHRDAWRAAVQASIEAEAAGCRQLAHVVRQIVPCPSLDAVLAAPLPTNRSPRT